MTEAEIQHASDNVGGAMGRASSEAAPWLSPTEVHRSKDPWLHGRTCNISLVSVISRRRLIGMLHPPVLSTASP